MNQQILSQDEVDALLQGITGESQKLEQEEVPEGGIRDYDLASQERIVRGRMPTMEIINERFARNIRIGLFNFIRKSPEVSIGGIKVQKYSAFLREIVVPTNFNIMACAAARQRADRLRPDPGVRGHRRAVRRHWASSTPASRGATSRPPSSA
jgi:flagellar motor switch protein FliM